MTSYRPGGFAARVLGEPIPLHHGINGQETQGPGAYSLAPRSVCVLEGILADLEAAAPTARVFKGTNP